VSAESPEEEGADGAAEAALRRASRDPLEAAFADLAREDRGARLAAVHGLGEALAGAARPGADLGPDDRARVARVVERLEAIVADRSKGTSWIRKRAKRALRKIRGEGEGRGEGGPDEA
jgi:hypothetical protein